MNIPISIEIPDEVSNINLNVIDLSRSIGIILDDTIEASTEIDDPIIRVVSIESENSVTLIAINRCVDDIPRVYKLFQEGFSTRGEGRDLGLLTLKEIADNTDSVSLNTIIENGLFIQRVEIINNQPQGCECMRIFTYKDDPEQRESMVTIIKNYMVVEEKPTEIVLTTDNPYEVFEQTKNMDNIDYYFLDTQLSTGTNGVKLGNEVHKHGPVGDITFITSHSELTYLTSTCKIAVIDFVSKGNLAKLGARIIDCLETTHTRLQLLSKDNSIETIGLKHGSNSVYVQYNDITFFEPSTKSRGPIIHLDNCWTEFYGNLKELSQLDDRFFRCRNGFVVDRHNIGSANSKEWIVYFKNRGHYYASVRNVKKI